MRVHFQTHYLTDSSNASQTFKVSELTKDETPRAKAVRPAKVVIRCPSGLTKAHLSDWLASLPGSCFRVRDENQENSPTDSPEKNVNKYAIVLTASNKNLSTRQLLERVTHTLEQCPPLSAVDDK